MSLMNKINGWNTRVTNVRRNKQTNDRMKNRMKSEKETDEERIPSQTSKKENDVVTRINGDFFVTCLPD